MYTAGPAQKKHVPLLARIAPRALLGSLAFAVACSAAPPQLPAGSEHTGSTAQAIDPPLATTYKIALSSVSIGYAQDMNGNSSYVEYASIGVQVNSLEADVASCSLGAVGDQSSLSNCVTGAEGIEGAPLWRDIVIHDPSDSVVVGATLDNIGTMSPAAAQTALAYTLSQVGNGAQLVGSLVAATPTGWGQIAGTVIGAVGIEISMYGASLGQPKAPPGSCEGGLIANPIGTNPGPSDIFTQTFTGQNLADLTASGPVTLSFRVATLWNGGCTSDEHLNFTISRDWSQGGLAAFPKSSDSAVARPAVGVVDAFRLSPGNNAIEHDSLANGSWASELATLDVAPSILNSPIAANTPKFAVADVSVPIASISRTSNNLDVFFVDDEGFVWWSSWTSPGPWVSEVIGAGAAQGGIVATSHYASDMEVFWVGQYGGMQEATWPMSCTPTGPYPGCFYSAGGNVVVPDPGLPSGWVGFGPPVQVLPSSSPLPVHAGLAAVARTPDDLEVYFVGSDGGIWANGWTRSTGSWTLSELPGTAGKAPPGGNLTAAARTTTNLDVFFVGNDGGIGTSSWYSPAPSFATSELPSTRGTANPGEPISVVSRQDENLDVAYVTGNEVSVSSYWASSAFTAPTGWSTSVIETQVFAASLYDLSIVAPSPWSLEVVYEDGFGKGYAQPWSYGTPSYGPPGALPMSDALQPSQGSITLGQNVSTPFQVTAVGGWATPGCLTLSTSGGPGGLLAEIGTPVAVQGGVSTTITLLTTFNTPPAGPQRMTITGTCNGVTSSAEVNVTVAATPVPLAVTLGNGKLLWSGQTDTGTVTLNEPAPAGTNITVTWTETGASLPPTIVSAPAGATSVSFPIPVPAATTTYLEATASANGYSITGLAGVASGQVTVFVSDTTSQTSETGTILLRAPAPAQGGVVALFADPATLLSLPASATIPAGSRSTTFNLRAGFVSKNQTKTATLTASYNGTWITEYVSIAGPTGTIGCVGVRCL